MSADCLVLTEWDIEGIPETEAWDNLFHKTVEAVLTEEGVDTPAEVEINIVDDEAIREMNASYRDLDSATDVLSFPLNELTAGDFDPALCERDPETGAVMLGDMMISLPRCGQQGEEFGHGFEREIMYLTVHSVLHLLGYDHVDEGEMKKQMRSREKAIMGDD